MSKTLVVLIDGAEIGHVIQDGRGRFHFAYGDAYRRQPVLNDIEADGDTRGRVPDQARGRGTIVGRDKQADGRDHDADHRGCSSA